MGRWGSRLFECDQDRDMSYDLDYVFKSHNLQLGDLPFEPPTSTLLAQTREKLDSGGLADQILENCRSRENDGDLYGGTYRTILAGALIMCAGAKIKPEDIKYLREAVPQVDCRYGYALPIGDFGLRHAGKVQFVAALDHYVAGTPRNFVTESCNTCGKIGADIGAPVKKCAGCELVWYCDKECQRKDWKKHKPHCMTLEQRSQGRPFVMLNV